MLKQIRFCKDPSRAYWLASRQEGLVPIRSATALADIILKQRSKFLPFQPHKDLPYSPRCVRNWHQARAHADPTQTIDGPGHDVRVAWRIV